MSSIRSFTDLKAVLDHTVQGTVFRITNRDMTAGLGLHALFENYAIVTVHETKEMEEARTLQPVISLESVIGRTLERTHEVGEKDPLQNQDVLQQMEALQGPGRYILPYSMSEQSMETLPTEYWKICATPPRERMLLDQRGTFIELAAESAIRTPPSALLSQPKPEDIRDFYGRYGSCVLQDLHEAAGMGTTFICNSDDLHRVTTIPFHGPKVLTQFIEGIDVSCTGCIFDHQIIIAPPRSNIVGCTELAHNNAQYCGNDWNIDLPARAYEEINHFIKRMGTVLLRRGYRGIFGMDFLWNTAEEQLYAIELNPRLLGTSQMYAVQQMEHDQPPLLGLHVASFLNAECQLYPEVIDQIAHEKLTGAHLIVRNKHDQSRIVTGDVQPGMYVFDGTTVRFVRHGVTYADIQGDNEFLVTMVPFQQSCIGPSAQLIRLQSRCKCFDETSRKLLPAASAMVRYLEDQLALQ